jgi:hypothetical protein
MYFMSSPHLASANFTVILSRHAHPPATSAAKSNRAVEPSFKHCLPNMISPVAWAREVCDGFSLGYGNRNVEPGRIAETAVRQ